MMVVHVILFRLYTYTCFSVEASSSSRRMALRMLLRALSFFIASVMSSFKSLMTNIYLVKRIFKASGYTPNRTLISKIFKDLSCLQRIAA